MTGEVRIALVSVTADDLDEINSVFDELTTYSQRIDGILRRDNAADEFATALPPGYGPHHKHAFLAKCEDVSVGLLDIIDGYPSPGTDFIGLLAVRESSQKAGVGRAIFHAAERFSHNTLRTRKLRLAVVEANPVIGFWIKMGFRSTGEVKPFNGAAIKSYAILMEKELSETTPYQC
ncbi:GNAT family N-acetyltransferase [Chelatococcus asaccharovorans]|uniref:GNAT family N-acetyltransferase n=1 Tax=Chelatococcus asaccharovorans TaxID=28210 RepID=UPI00224C7395|nr:GNAT family N-acetyltransferase [Chelatococcus asaccharovorans]CAH1653018.1 GCN5-related N-acetyltransferase [Chelatococcus asaccharovorans]CAH1686169.1 GCN5-related N-acetyltransferase [Chelatococcus asaccharovorans]